MIRLQRMRFLAEGVSTMSRCGTPRKWPTLWCFAAVLPDRCSRPTPFSRVPQVPSTSCGARMGRKEPATEPTKADGLTRTVSTPGSAQCSSATSGNFCSNITVLQPGTGTNSTGTVRYRYPVFFFYKILQERKKSTKHFQKMQTIITRIQKNYWWKLIILEHKFKRTLPRDNIKVLIGDNLASHLSPFVLSQCEQFNIRFVFLPENSTHMMQPLDKCVFRPLKQKWRKMQLEGAVQCHSSESMSSLLSSNSFYRYRYRVVL